MKEYTLLDLWKDNKESSKKLYVRSKNNQTDKYEVILVQPTKNRAILMNRGKGFFGYFKKYYQIFSINNKRWVRI